MTLHALWLGLAEEPQMKHEINKTYCDQTGSHWRPQAGSFQINSCQFLSKTITFIIFITKRGAKDQFLAINMCFVMI